MIAALAAIGLALMAVPLPAAYSRLEGPVSLLAGSPAPGNRDGHFLSAQFKAPTGLGFDAKERRLYVADSGNRTIRSLEVSMSPVVKTELLGAGAKSPVQLLYLGEQGLLVRDGQGNIQRLEKSGGAWDVAPLNGLPGKASWVFAGP